MKEFRYDVLTLHIVVIILSTRGEIHVNAYELANALAAESSQMEYGYVVSDWELLDTSANMLRQQADRITELEKDLHMIQRHYDQLDTQTKPLSDDEIWNWFKENTALTKESALRIARAIEERHGIK